MFRGTGSIAFAAILVALLPGTASAVTPGSPVTPVTTTVVVAEGVGSQTDPHISGALVTYTDRQSASNTTVHYHDLVSGVDSVVPGGTLDQLSGVGGSIVVFQRGATDSSSRSIMAFDTAVPAAAPTALAPDPTVRRAFPSVGARTVAWQQFVGSSSVASDIHAYDLDTAATTPLSSDGVTSTNRDAAVSDDGTVIAWAKCALGGSICDIWRSIRGPGGTWGVPRQLTADIGEEILPDTDGQTVVYASDASGEWDIHWLDVAGTNADRLVMAGSQTNPNMSGSLVSFEHTDPGATDSDLFAYDRATGTLYQLTDTPTVDETLNDISVAADGTVRVVFAALAPSSPGNDVYATTFRISTGPAYVVCPLFDQTKSHRLGSVVPIRLQLCDAAGRNVSSASSALAAIGLVKKDGSASTALVEDAGNANPDSAFRYDDTLPGYVYNLSTRGLSRGTWELRFMVSGDTSTYTIAFDLR